MKNPDNKILVHINTLPFVAEWTKFHFGNPVTIHQGTPLSGLLRQVLQLQPQDSTLEHPEDYNLHIALPNFKFKDTRQYNYLSQRNRKVIANHFEVKFENNMWIELLQYCKLQGSESAKIYAYMESHGISDDHFDAIRKRYYRIKKKYYENEKINLK